MVLVLFLIIYYSAFATAQQYFQWSSSAGGGADDYVNSIVCPANNKIYAAGGFVDTICSDNTKATGYGMRDIFLACYNSNGDPEWIKTLGGIEADNVTRLAMGNKCIYMVGVVSGEIKQDKKSFSGKGRSLFIASWSLNGKINWLKRFDYNGMITSDVLEVNSEGQIITGGLLQGKINTDDGELSSKGGKRAYVMILSDEGVLTDTYISKGKGEHRLVSATFDRENNGYYLFSTTGSFEIGNNNKQFQTISVKSGLMLIKCPNLDNPSWIKYIENSLYSEGVRVVSPSQGVFLCVNFKDRLKSDDTIFNTESRQAVALLQYNETGELNWGEVIHGSSYCRAMDAMCNVAGNILVTGYYISGYKVCQTEINGNNPEGNIFLIQFNDKGEVTWHNEPGDNAPNFSKSFTLSQTGDILLAGGFKGTLELEGQKLTSAGNTDCFIAKYFNCSQLETRIFDPGPLCKGGEAELSSSGTFISRLWNNSEWGNTFLIQEPGTYFVTAYNDFGCAATDTIEISELEMEDLGLPEEVHLETGQEILLQANQGFITYDWSDGKTGNDRRVIYDPLADSLKLVLTASNSNGCEVTDSVMVYFQEEGEGSQLAALQTLKTFPNPVEKDLYWYLKHKQKEVVVTLTKSDGELMYTKEILNYLPGTVHKIDMQKLVSGNYLLTVSCNNNMITEKVVKR